MEIINNHSRDIESKKQADKKASRIRTYNYNTDLISEIVEQMTAQIVLNLPSKQILIDINGEKFVTWRVGNSGHFENPIFMLADGRLIEAPYLKFYKEIFLKTIKNLDALPDPSESTISRIAMGICKQEMLNNFHIRKNPLWTYNLERLATATEKYQY